MVEIKVMVGTKVVVGTKGMAGTKSPRPRLLPRLRPLRPPTTRVTTTRATTTIPLGESLLPNRSKRAHLMISKVTRKVT